MTKCKIYIFENTKLQIYILYFCYSFVIVTDWANNKNTILPDLQINLPPPIPEKSNEIIHQPKKYISEYKLKYYDYNEAQKLSPIPPPLPKRNKKMLLPQQMAPKLPRRKITIQNEDYLPDMTPPPLIRRNNGFRIKQKSSSPRHSKDDKVAEVKCDVIAYI